MSRGKQDWKTLLSPFHYIQHPMLCDEVSFQVECLPWEGEELFLAVCDELSLVLQENTLQELEQTVKSFLDDFVNVPFPIHTYELAS